MNLQKRIVVNEEKRSRKVYDENMTRMKNEIYRETEKWQLKK
jgi:fibrillarin-like rRNA methylase